MKFDMHCHTKEGSMDCKVPIEQYIEILKSNGFQGMLVSDHNSYNGYRHWKKYIRGKKHTDFVVLKGIEYDTIDAGHILVILPAGVKVPLMELRGLPVGILIDIVHRHGGILGPAHPCGEKFLSFTNTRKFRKAKSVMDSFDFVEAFNACETEESNAGARLLSNAYGKPGFGGSDSHKPECVGKAYTEIDAPISDETDFINYISSGNAVACGGTYYRGTTKEKIGKIHSLLVLSFWFYNRGGWLLRKHRRKNALLSDDEIILNEINTSRRNRYRET